MTTHSSERHQNPRRRRYYRPKKTKVSPKDRHSSNQSTSSSTTSPPRIFEDNKHEFTLEEQKIFDIAKNSYNSAMEHYFYPSLPLPHFLFDYSNNTGFHIDFNSYKITLNLANTPNIYLDHEFQQYFHSLSLHEIAHYIYCPYDNATNLKLLSAVIKQGISKFYAPIVINIFSDLVIDYRNHLDFGELMEWELKVTIENILKNSTEEVSELWKLLVVSYEIMWKFKIVPKFLDIKTIKPYAERLCDIIQKDFEDDSTWEQKIKKIAFLLKDILKENCKLKSSQTEYSSGDQLGSSGAGNSPIDIPEDVKNTFGNLGEIKYPDFVKKSDDSQFSAKGPEAREQIMQNMEEMSPNLNYSTFHDLLNLNGFNDSMENLAAWYRGRAKNLLDFKVFRKTQGGAIPFTPQIWRIGDPIEELDPTLSLLSSPILIPNITTRKWEYHLGTGKEIHHIIPDLMIVLDSSGSMDWNFGTKNISGRYHTALMAAFAAIQFAIMKGAYCAGINFSDNVRTVPWSNQIHQIEKLLLKYQGYGTVLPINQVERLAQKNEHPCLILLISDLEIENWDAAKHNMLRLLKNNHKIIGFFIEGDPSMLNSPAFDDLVQLGARFFVIQNEKDLVGLVISEVESIYNPNSDTT